MKSSEMWLSVVWLRVIDGPNSGFVPSSSVRRDTTKSLASRHKVRSQKTRKIQQHPLSEAQMSQLVFHLQYAN